MALTGGKLTTVLRRMNRHLQKLDCDLSLEMEVDAPVTITFGKMEHNTTLRLQITEQGIEPVDVDEQVDRIENELYDRIVNS